MASHGESSSTPTRKALINDLVKKYSPPRHSITGSHCRARSEVIIRTNSIAPEIRSSHSLHKTYIKEQIRALDKTIDTAMAEHQVIINQSKEMSKKVDALIGQQKKLEDKLERLEREFPSPPPTLEKLAE